MNYAVWLDVTRVGVEICEFSDRKADSPICLRVLTVCTTNFLRVQIFLWFGAGCTSWSPSSQPPPAILLDKGS